eukprot:8804486-Heterocapsa_arctica.AAC.1
MRRQGCEEAVRGHARWVSDDRWVSGCRPLQTAKHYSPVNVNKCYSPLLVNTHDSADNGSGPGKGGPGVKRR